jgi:YD repeat-containing protein
VIKNRKNYPKGQVTAMKSCSTNRTFFPFFMLIFTVFLISNTTSIFAEDGEVDPGQITFRTPVSEIQNEKIDPYTGELSLTYTDLTLPGNGGLDLSIVRTYQGNRIFNYTPLGNRWDIHMGRIKLNGDYIIIELQDGTMNTAVIDSEWINSDIYRTKDFWKFDWKIKTLQLPDGTRIEFTHYGAEYWIYATKISKNGNQIIINYNAGSRNISSITDTLGRIVNFSYAYISGESRLVSIRCTNDPNLQVQYGYPGSGEFPSTLSRVVFPGNEIWEYSYVEYYHLYGESFHLRSVFTPYGGTAVYTHDYFPRYSNGKSIFYQFSVNSKTVSGTQLNGTWVFEYGKDTNRDRDFTKITDPCNRVTTYWFFGYHGTNSGECYKYGLQDEMEIRDAANNNALEHREQNTWGKISQEISTMPYETTVCQDNNTYVPILTKQEITTLGGDTYVTQYSNYDNYGNPGTKTETGTNTRTTTSTYWYDEDDNIVKNKPKTVSIQGDSNYLGSFAMVYNYEQNTGNPVFENKFGIITTKTYASNGNLRTSTDGNGKTTTYEWTNGAVSSISNPIYTINREVNWNGTVASETDGRSCAECTTRFEYDDAMRLTKKTPQVGNPILYTYHFGTGAYTRQTRGGFLTTTLYDGLGREIGSVDSIGNQTNTHFSDCGLKEWTSSTTGDTQYYDHLGRQTKSVHKDGSVMNYTNHSDRHVTIADEAGYKTELYYDTFADPSEKYLRLVTDPLANNAAYTYNVLGSLTSASYAGLAYGYTYTAANLIQREIRPDGSVATYTHDNAGNVTSKDDSLVTKIYQYDDINRLTSVTAGGETLGYVYDDADNLMRTTSSHGIVTSSYDGAKRLTGSTVNALDRSGSLAYSYDNNDNLTKITFPSGMQLDYTYNAWNQVTGITGFGGAVTGINYFTSGAQLGLLKGYTFSNGQSTVLTYDNRRALTSTMSGVSKLGFSYDGKRGNLSAVTDSLDSNKNKSFSYDEFSRLRNYNGSWGAGRFDYFINGNRSKKILETTLSYSYTNGDRLTSAAYNGDGDMTSMNGLVFDYNPFHRLYQVRENGAVLAGYGYDANGLRIFKTGSETKIYLNGPDGNVLSELDGSGDTLADYVYLNGTLVAKVGEPDNNPVVAPWLLLLLNDDK